MKRFTDTDIWKKEWFQDLNPAYKLAWFYIKDNCDAVGVWDSNYRLANFQIGIEINWEEFREKCNGNIYVLPNKKWWLIDFCSFQYGGITEDSKSPPIVSYIKLLKKHNLWEVYLKGIDTLKEKEKDIEKVKEKKKESQEKEIKHKHGEYQHVILTDAQLKKVISELGEHKAKYMIKVMDEAIEEKGNIWHISNFAMALLKWAKKDTSYKPPQQTTPSMPRLPRPPKCPTCGKPTIEYMYDGAGCKPCGVMFRYKDKWIREKE